MRKCRQGSAESRTCCFHPAPTVPGAASLTSTGVRGRSRGGPPILSPIPRGGPPVLIPKNVVSHAHVYCYQGFPDATLSAQFLFPIVTNDKLCLRQTSRTRNIPERLLARWATLARAENSDAMTIFAAGASQNQSAFWRGAVVVFAASSLR